MSRAQTPEPRRFWLGGRRAAEQDRFFREALEPLGWQPGDETRWDAAWITGMPDPAQFRRVSPHRKLNHFPGNAALTVKSRLYASLAHLRERIHAGVGADSEAATRLAFFPRAYEMPRDYHALQAAALARPDQRWILKPTNASKGKGVRVLRDVAEAPLARDWLVQEYLANPHTIRGHKYVLRLYVLISSLEPLRVYRYRQGFAKLASEPWDPEDIDNLFSQLTNPDINARNENAEVPVEFIDLDRYRAWLRDQGHDDGRLFARIDDLVALTAISAVDAMRRRTAEAGVDPRGCYELLGLDCLVDDTLKPWILECNLSPSLGICAGPESGGRVEEAVKGGLVRDMVALVDLPGLREPSEAPDEAARLLEEAEAELACAGDFQRLLPSGEPERYLPCFALPSRADLLLAEALTGRPVTPPRLGRRRVTELIDGEQLALYAPEHGCLYRPNASAALIWLLVTEGLAPDAIVDELARLAAEADGPPDLATLRREVWQTLGEWCRLGLLCQTQGEAPVASDPPASPDSANALARLALEIDGRYWVLETLDAAALGRLEADFAGRLAPLSTEVPDETPRLSVLREPGVGYALAADGELIASRLPLARLGEALTRYLLRRAAAPDRPVVDAALLTGEEGAGVLCLLPADHAEAKALVEGWRREVPGARIGRGLRLDLRGPGAVEPLGLPLPGAPDDALRGAAITLRGVLLAEAVGEEGVPSSLDLLAALLPRLVTAEGAPPDGGTLQGLGEWLAGLPRWRDSTGETAALEAWLEERLYVRDEEMEHPAPEPAGK